MDQIISDTANWLMSWVIQLTFGQEHFAYVSSKFRGCNTCILVGTWSDMGTCRTKTLHIRSPQSCWTLAYNMNLAEVHFASLSLHTQLKSAVQSHRPTYRHNGPSYHF